MSNKLGMDLSENALAMLNELAKRANKSPSAYLWGLLLPAIQEMAQTYNRLRTAGRIPLATGPLVSTEIIFDELRPVVVTPEPGSFTFVVAEACVRMLSHAWQVADAELRATGQDKGRTWDSFREWLATVSATTIGDAYTIYEAQTADREMKNLRDVEATTHTVEAARKARHEAEGIGGR